LSRGGPPGSTAHHGFRVWITHCAVVLRSWPVPRGSSTVSSL